jgi:hypothetical protein
MKRIVRFVFIAAAMVAIHFAYTLFFSPILEQLMYEGVNEANTSAMMTFTLISQGLAAVIFIVLYIRWYIAVPENKREFLKYAEETGGYSIKSGIVHHIEENKGNIDILIYMLYSLILPLSVFIFNGSSPITFLYFNQLIFYNFPVVPVLAIHLIFSYTFSTLFFLAGYIGGVVLLHKRWYKTRLRR